MSKAAITRTTILQKALELIYKNGYQATSIDDILATTLVTKGAFYYHFRNKEEMGVGMIREVLYPGMHEVIVTPLLEGKDPVVEIYQMMKALLGTNPFFNVKYGCPVVNLIEEMAPLNKAFRKELLVLVMEWKEALQKVIESGQRNGIIRKEVEASEVAYFIMIGYNGVRNLGKLHGKDIYNIYLQELKRYLENLR